MDVITKQKELQIFKKENLELRTINIDGEPWFVLADIAQVLDIQNTSQLADQLRDSQRAIYNIGRETSGNSEAIIINESGLYRLLLRSKKPQAESFQIWVEDEVLPTIRKTGKYEINLPTSYKEALLALVRKEEEREVLQLQIESQKDKVEFAEQLLDTTNAIDFKTAAKAMNLGYGRNTLFVKCKELGILDRSNQPYQKYVDAGYFVVLETFFNHPKTGDKHLTTKTLITAKGQQFLLKKLNQELALMGIN